MTLNNRNPTDARYRHVIPAGDFWIHEISKGEHFRIVDLHGNQSADTMFYNGKNYADRYSARFASSGTSI
jgi:uncharacterized protein